MIDVAIPINSKIRQKETQESREIQMAERGTLEDLEVEDNSGPSGNWSIWK